MLSMIDPLDRKIMVQTLNISWVLNSEKDFYWELSVLAAQFTIETSFIGPLKLKTNIEYPCIWFKWLVFFSQERDWGPGGLNSVRPGVDPVSERTSSNSKIDPLVPKTELIQ